MGRNRLTLELTDDALQRFLAPFLDRTGDDAPSAEQPASTNTRGRKPTFPDDAKPFLASCLHRLRADGMTWDQCRALIRGLTGEEVSESTLRGLIREFPVE